MHVHSVARAALLSWTLAITASCPSPSETRRDAGAVWPPIQDAGRRDAAPVTDAGPPPITDWRARTIYLVMPDRFWNGDPDNDALGVPGCLDPDEPRRYHGGDLQGLLDRIDYLADLGIGALWTTPVYAQAGCGYHGYWADFRIPDDGAIEPRMGDAATFDTLLAALDALDIEYVIDLVVNHAGYGAAITRDRPDWFHDPATCAQLGSPVIHCPLSNLPDFAQERDDVASYLVDKTRGWLRRHQVGGIRMDTAKHVPLDFFASRWIPAVRAERPGLFLIAEVFDGSGAAVLAPYLNAGFDSAFNFSVRVGLIDTFARGGSTNLIADRVAGTIDDVGIEAATHLTNFLDNHDVPRWPWEIPDDVPAAERTARYHLALVALFTIPGVPQLYYGAELGFDGAGDANRRDMPVWAFSAPGRAGAGVEPTFALVRDLIALRRSHRALWAGDYAELWRKNAGDANVYAFLRTAGEEQLLVVMNADDAPATVTLPYASHPDVPDPRPDGTPLIDLLGRGAPAASVEDGTVTVTLPAWTAGLYRL